MIPFYGCECKKSSCTRQGSGGFASWTALMVFSRSSDIDTQGQMKNANQTSGQSQIQGSAGSAETGMEQEKAKYVQETKKELEELDR